MFSAICEQTNTAVLTGSSVSMTGLHKFNYMVQTFLKHLLYIPILCILYPYLYGNGLY